MFAISFRKRSSLSLDHGPGPLLAQANPTIITSAEWATYSQAVAVMANQLAVDIDAIDDTILIEGEPPMYTANPNNATGRLAATQQVTAWLHRLQAQHTALVNERTQQAAIAQALQNQLQQQQQPQQPQQQPGQPQQP
jgi:hypothetical protein